MADPDIVAAGEALRARARDWDDLADTTDRARSRVADLALHPAAFAVVDGETGLPEAYANRSDRLTRLLRQAGEEFDHLATALRAAAEVYEAGDAAVADRLDGIR